MESWTSNPKVQMKNSNLVKKKIQKLIADGPLQLQMVSDFDSTLSRAHLDGRKIKSSFCVVEDDPRIVPEDIRKEYNELTEKYVAIETDPKLTREEKLPHMIKWWNNSFTTLLKAGITDEQMREIARRGEIRLRCQAIEMLKLLEANGIPCLVFSAGLGEIVTYTLQHNNALLSNVTVISNYLKFRDTAEGPKAEIPDDLIHTYNKNAECPSAQKYFATDKIRSRKNAILLGDNLGDSHMIDGAPGIIKEPPVGDPKPQSDGSTTANDGGYTGIGSTVLRFGFLNNKIETRLPTFLDTFDVVLLDDQTMNVPLDVLKAIIAGKQT